MEIVEEIVRKPAFGGGGGRKKDDSVDNPMNYAEKFIMTKEFLEMVVQLKISVQDGNKIIGGSIFLTQSDLPDYFKDGTEGVNGACHLLNKVFCAAGFPLYATSYATETADKIIKIKSRGKHINDAYTVVVSDRIRIYRISDTFEIDRYACDDSKKVRVDGITNYHQYTEGMYLREQRWLHENYPEMKDTLEKLGYKEE